MEHSMEPGQRIALIALNNLGYAVSLEVAQLPAGRHFSQIGKYTEIGG